MKITILIYIFLKYPAIHAVFIQFCTNWFYLVFLQLKIQTFPPKTQQLKSTPLKSEKATREVRQVCDIISTHGRTIVTTQQTWRKLKPSSCYLLNVAYKSTIFASISLPFAAAVFQLTAIQKQPLSKVLVKLEQSGTISTANPSSPSISTTSLAGILLGVGSMANKPKSKPDSSSRKGSKNFKKLVKWNREKVPVCGIISWNKLPFLPTSLRWLKEAK